MPVFFVNTKRTIPRTLPWVPLKWYKRRMDPAFQDAVAKSLGKNFLETEAEALEHYGRDWTTHLVPRPSALVRPRSTAEVSHFLSLCTQFEVAVVPSGGRTGLSGGAVASRGEVVLNLERMNALGTVDSVGRTVCVGAGAITAGVRAHCEEVGLTWPIRFSADGSSQIGGNISTNAGGMHVVHYGSTRQWVMGLEVVLMSGEVLQLGGTVEKDNTGPDLKHLFIGAEGILGVVTEVTLKLCPLPTATKLLYFSVESLGATLALFESLRDVSSAAVLAFEVMAQNCVRCVEKQRGISSPLPGQGAYSVLVELQTSSSGWEDWVGEALDHEGVASGVWARSPREEQELWDLRDGIGEALARLGRLHKNDVCVPVYRLEEFVSGLDEVLELEVPNEVYLFGHVGDGNLHLNVVKPQELSDSEFDEACARRDRRLYEWVCKLGGSLSAEHGIGRLKAPFLGLARSPEEIRVLRQIKSVFDPKGLLNPGNVLEVE